MKTQTPTCLFGRHLCLRVLFVLMGFLGAGCRTTHLLPPVNLSAPGWNVQQGQAVWKPSSSRPEIAGDLLFATNVNGNVFIQFSKIPFPIVNAQISSNQWQIEFGADQYVWHGSGTPPGRFAWFQLSSALRQAKLGSTWQFSQAETNTWLLKNSHTGETLEGDFY